MAGTEKATEQKRREIAHGCTMTVLTEPNPFIYNDNAIATALATTYPELVPENEDSLRYDLLSMPDLKYLPKNSMLFEQTVQDLLIALELHNAEHLLVVTADHEHAPVVRRLKDDPRLRKRLRLIRGYTAKARRSATSLKTMAIPCMDWRKHDGGGFLDHFANAFGGGDTVGVMTVPGAAKEIEDGSVRGQLVRNLLGPLVRKGLSRVVLVSHTDCGKYGGSKAFGSSEDEKASLAADLRGAAAFLRYSFGTLKVECGIAHISGDRISRIEPLAV